MSNQCSTKDDFSNVNSTHLLHAPGADVGGAHSSIALRPSAYIGKEHLLEEVDPAQHRVLFALNNSVGSSHALEFAVTNHLVHKSDYITIMIITEAADVHGKRTWYGLRQKKSKDLCSRIYREHTIEQEALVDKFSKYLAEYDIKGHTKIVHAFGKKHSEIILDNVYETSADLLILPSDDEMLSNRTELTKDKRYIIENAPVSVLLVTSVHK